MGNASHVEYALFETAFGTCGLAWSAHGIRRLQLPEADVVSTEKYIQQASGAETSSVPYGLAAHAIGALQQYFAGQAVMLGDILLDLAHTPPFHRSVYHFARDIERRRTMTYGDLARLAGQPGGARAVGQAMARNPVPVIVPCHRIVAAGGKPGGFSAPGGVLTKARLLDLEGGGLTQDQPALPLGWP
jgi:methylated-DNA-[protein]-cysteine S-methyltransferase